ncbi:DksA/TraR family C4-type zinc finger protein [Salinisphaera sp. Q1T1-3]|uniref:DksA/TraR family C4-type zinc finger protein n=1 Tax=Salinisphaera sp. Q1T1-3 TaxID=2321229 RepID=UPI000E75D51C|nr:DksA/TraR family C4-type zinc finger protein [Salinisphaera sp. Q1T1-3]RJS93066.1 DksA/TraR family C4-type zinc finger protein [Salinisphaera sp. Q1T1-3]
MASGWAQEGGVQEQIDATIDEGVAAARARLAAASPSLTHCEDCEEPIPERRRELVPGVRRCVACQAEADAHDARQGGVNRRASKDSLLR